jgi:hypothetical protein
VAGGRLILPLAEPVLNESGVIDPLAILTVYETGTTTVAALFGDAGLTLPITNPQNANAAGRFYDQATAIYADDSAAYDCVLQLTDGETFTWDEISLLGPPLSVGGFAPLNSPAFTGNPTAPTPAANNNSNSIATTAFVVTALEPYAPLASPAFSGVPTVPTAAPGTNTTQAASTAFVEAALGDIPTRIYANLSVAGGVLSILSQNGFGAITRSGTGAINFNFSSAMADTNYGFTYGIQFATSLVAMMGTATKTVNAFSVQVLEPSNNLQQDPTEIFIEVIGS